MPRAFIWASCAIFAWSSLTNVSAAEASGCQLAHARDKRVGAQITEGRVLKAAREAVQKSQVKTQVAVCRLTLPYISATAEHLANSYYMAVTNRLVARFNNAELRAVFGHEMAHIVLGQRAAGFELTHRRRAKYEQEADAVSATWFGRTAMRSVVRKLLADTRNLPDPSERREAIRELNARIQRLQ
jgi:Peptidase family M48